MLKKLIIKNIALIDNMQIDFTDGLNVLSGETGAGKSVIIDSLNFVLGAKADKSLIRSGQTECLTIAEFDVEKNKNIVDVFNELDIENDDILIISRKFNIDGKSTIKVNGNSVSASMLKKFTSKLVDVYGQSEHFNLLNSTNQLLLIDKFGGHEILSIKNDLHNDFAEYKNVLTKLNQFGGDDSQRLIRLDILNYQIDEISKANLKDDEEEILITNKQKIQNHEKIVNTLRLVNDSISSEGGIEDKLSTIKKNMTSIADFDSFYMQISQRLEDVFAEIDDISNTASNILYQIDDNEYDLNDIESRLDLIKKLKSKYGNSVKEINAFLQNAILEKEKLENYAEQIVALEKERDLYKKKIYSAYLQLNEKRLKFAKLFKNNVITELQELGMKKANFDICFTPVPTIEECLFVSPNGFDEIEFLFSANMGEPLKSLSKVISGGEMSRFMLSIKAQTAKYDDISTFIFDEIDAGISGNVAKVVAEKFAKISKSTQIIAITHLPQISAMADNNLLIEKNETDSKTLTTIKHLSSEEKILEIVRLVGGDIKSQSAISHSKEIIANALNFKKKI